MITIANKHEEIIDTNFWETEFAASGKFYCSINARCLRVLLPPQFLKFEADICSAKKVELERNGAMVTIWFDDATPAPFRLETDIQGFDRMPGKGTIKLIVYGPGLRKIYDGSVDCL